MLYTLYACSKISELLKIELRKRIRLTFNQWEKNVRIPILWPAHIYAGIMIVKISTWGKPSSYVHV